MNVDNEIEGFEESRKACQKELATIERKLNEAKQRKNLLKVKNKRLKTAYLRKAAFNRKHAKSVQKSPSEKAVVDDVNRVLDFDDEDDDKLIEMCDSMQEKSPVKENLFPEGEGADAKNSEEILEELE